MRQETGSNDDQTSKRMLIVALSSLLLGKPEFSFEGRQMGGQRWSVPTAQLRI